MSTTITAGNATNGLAFSADNTGILELKTGTGSGTTAVTISTAQAVTLAGNLTLTGNASGILKLGTAVTASGASVDFINIPSTVKRVTVMMNGLSYAAAGVGVLRVGTGSTLVTTGYTSNVMSFAATPVITPQVQTNGMGSLTTGAAASTINGVYVLTNVTGTIWSFSMQLFRVTDNVSAMANGFVDVGGPLNLVSLIAQTSTFDAGTVNLLWE